MIQRGIQKSIQKAARTAVLFAFFALVFTFVNAPTTQAQEAPIDPVEPLVFVLPAACTPTTPVDPVDPPLEGEPVAVLAGIEFAATAPTNSAPLTWTWVTTLPTEDPVPVLSGYGYAVYRDDVFEAQGVLTGDATSVSYAPTSDGTYRVYVWAIEEGTDEELYCANAVTPFNATAPVITGTAYAQKGNVATPQLTSDETDVLFSWAVTGGPAGGATISDPALLTPQFTFLSDGTYEFTLIATDSFGNVTTLVLTIEYLAPFIPGPTAPLIPEEAAPKPVEPYVRPVSVTTTPAAEEYPSATTPQPVDAQVLAGLDGDDETRGDAAITSTASAITPSEQGWKLFGLAWYWWILIAAIIISGWLWTVRTYRAAGRPDDL